MEKELQQILALNSPRADFKPENFDILVYQKGYSMMWEQGMLCSCYDPNSGQPDYYCPACHGKGYVYFGAKKTRALVTSIRGTKVQGTIGLDDVGSAYLTPLSTDDVGFRDRFTFLDFQTKYSQNIVCSTGVTSYRLRYQPLSIICVRDTVSEYLQGRDFSISDDGWSINWSREIEHPNNSFSILYKARPVYIAINPIHELRGTFIKEGGRGLEKFVEMHKQYQIKREDFLTSDSLW